MNDPVAILYEAVRQAKEIPELVQECGGDAGKIMAWVDQYPGRTSLLAAFQEAGEGTVRFAFDSAGPAGGEDGAWWEYRYVVQFTPTHEEDPYEGAILRMWRALANGVVDSTGQRWIYTCFAPHTSAPLTLRATRRQFTSFGKEPLEVFLGQFVIADREP